MPSTPLRRAKKGPRPWVSVALAIAGAAALGGSATIVVSIHDYKHHTAAIARQLTRHLVTAEHHATTIQPGTDRPTCTAPPPSSPAAGSGVRMILEAPAIGLVAPVLDSDTTAALNQGIGHLPASTWPDQGGTVVLEAHDVTFFAELAQLRPGDIVALHAPCRTWTYQVATGNVVTQGTPIPSEATPTLVMVTCWPTNALYFTDHRYVLSAQLAGATRSGPVPPRPPSFTVPVATLPAGVDPQAVSVDTLGVPEGTLQVSTAIAPALRASSAALAATAAAIETFDTGLLAQQRHRPSWWTAVTTSVPYAAAAPLATGPPVWTSPVQINLGGHGDAITTATLTSSVSEHNTDHRMTVGLSTVGGRWTITSWIMT